MAVAASGSLSQISGNLSFGTSRSGASMVIVLVGLVIGYLVLAYFAARTWQVWHVVLISGVFFSTILFAYLAAANLKTQMKFRKQYADALANLEREEQKYNLLMNGDPTAGDDAPLAMIALEGNVKRALLDRGRVWRNIVLGTLDEVDGQKSVTLNTSQWGNPAAKLSSASEDDDLREDNGGDTPTTAGADPMGLEVGALVFAYRNTPVRALSPEQQAVLLGSESELLQNDEKGLIRVPTAYMGEFLVTAVAGDHTSITLSPTMEPDERQIELIADPNAFWVLYEIMPQDAHDVFAALTPDEIRTLFPTAEVGIDNQTLDSIVNDYVRDQQTAEAADDPNRKWIKVVFKQPYSVTVDVQDPTPEPESPFDGTGRATSAILRQDEETKFAKDDEAILDYETAQQLERDGVVTLGEAIYSRRLRHYETAFRSNYVATQTAMRDIAVAQDELDSLNQSIKQLQEQIAFRADEHQKLTADKEGFEYEVEAITSLRKSLTAQWQTLKSELSKLYRANRQLATRGIAIETLQTSAP